MATIVNDRDVLMQGTSPRFTSGGASKGLVLSASSGVFNVSTGGVGSPTSITLTASLIGITGTVTFSTSPSTTLSVSGNTATLAYSNMLSNSVAVTATIVDSGSTYTHTQTISKLQALGALATQNSVNLSTQITGVLASGNISGLGALAALNSLNLSSGLVYGALDATTQVNNLGNLAFANSVAANQIGAGTLAAGVIYSGVVNASQVNAGIFTGHTYKTAGSGTYIGINEGGNNQLKYYIGGSSVCEIGGSFGTIWATSNSSISSTISGIATGPLTGVAGTASSGYGVLGTSSSGTGVRATGPTAIYADGLITMPARTAGVNNTTLNSVIASADNSYQCGYIGARWANIYAANNVIQTSDVRSKENIRDLDYGLEFIMSLRPVSYTMIVGQNDIEVGPEQFGPWPDGQPPEREVKIIPRKGVRTHLGFIAQEVREALGRGDVALWSLDDKDDPDSPQSLTYTEMIAPLTKAVQELGSQVRILAGRVEKLEGKA